jgi:hypothetical protein
LGRVTAPDADGVTYVYAQAPQQLRQSPGAFAWISLALLILAGGALTFAFIVGAYAGALISMFAVIVLLLPTLILMAVWFEVRADNRKLLLRYEAERSSSTKSH